MTSNADATTRIIGSLRSADGKGVVRMEDRLGRSPATPKRAGSSSCLPIKTWPPASARATAGRACYGVIATVSASWFTSQSVGFPNSSWKTLGPFPVQPR